MRSVVIGLSTGGKNQTGRSRPASPAKTHTSGTARSAPPAPETPAGGAAFTPSGSAAATPPGAVESFYEAAAQHGYAAAWALADSNLRNQLGGYSDFQNQMSSVRSITFHRAETIGGAGSDAATVALETTSSQTDRTQQCAGTARTVRSREAWVLDGIAIRCSG